MVRPEDIEKALKDIAPFGRKAIAANFEGLQVNWKLLYFSTIEEYGGKTHFITFQVPPESGLFLFLVFVHGVDIEKYPRFKTLNQKTKVIVRGTIINCKYNETTLGDCEFYFEDAQEENLPTQKNLVDIASKPEAVIEAEVKASKNNEGHQVNFGKPKNRFSMDNPVTYLFTAILAVLILALIGFVAHKAGLPLQITSTP